MSKVYFFMQEIAAAKSTTPVLPDVYCPTGGYHDKNLAKTFASRGQKYRYLRQHGLKEAEIFNPEKSLGGTDGCSVKSRGTRGNFKVSQMPSWMKQELTRHVG